MPDGPWRPGGSNQAVSNQAVSNQAVSNQAVSSQAVGSQAVSSQTVGNQAVGSQAVGNQAVSNQAVSNQTANNQTVSNQTVSSSDLKKDRGKTSGYQKNIISWQEGAERLCARAAAVGAEYCQAAAALDRILAEDVVSLMEQPPFRRSAMDGYAARYTDLAGASAEAPAELLVTGRIFAGDAPLKEGMLQSGTAVRIMTGAPVPDGADCVIPQEDTDYGEKRVRVFKPGQEGSNISPAGEDFARGECLIRSGTRLDAYALSCACAAGIEQLPVRKQLRAGILTTGSELCEPGKPLVPGKIYNSNEAFLMARLRQLGCRIVQSVFAEDDAELIAETLTQMARKTDLIVTTGGVSVGILDLIPAVLEKAGAEILFHGIALKPGMPTLGAVYNGVPVLALSGNPFSAAAVFELLGRPLIHKLQGSAGKALLPVKAALANETRNNGRSPRIAMGWFDGALVRVYAHQRNAQMKYGIGSNCMVILPPGPADFAAGDVVEVYL